MGGTDRQQAKCLLERFTQRRERVAAAGGEMLGAVFNFLGELVAEDDSSPAPPSDVVRGLRDNLAQCVEEDANGQQRLTVTLPNRDALDNLANTLARLLASSQPPSAPE